MRSIFIGMLFVFVNINIIIGSSLIGLVPTFFGYLCILGGLSELKGYSTCFTKATPWVKGMVIYSAFCYAMNLLGAGAVDNPYGLLFGSILGISLTIISLFIAYNIIMGIKDIETTKVQNLNSVQLYSTWKMLAVLSIGASVFIFVPVLNLACAIAGFVVAVYYIFIFNKTKKLFYIENPTT